MDTNALTDFLKRLFGAKKSSKELPAPPLPPRMEPPTPKMSPETPSSPSSVWWDGVSSNPLALIHVVLPKDRSQPGTLVALDAQGRLVSGPWPAVGKADEAMAADRGNRACDPLLPFGDTPTGELQVIDILPARVDATGIFMFGVNKVIRLRAVSGTAALADSNGRTALLIHGGSDPSAPTDGSIRVPDEAMDALLALLPPNPSVAKPRVKVRIEEFVDDRADRAKAWRTRPATFAAEDARVWRAQGAYPTRVSPSYNWQTGQYDDNGYWFGYYQQMYLFDILSQTPYDDRCQPGDSYPYVDCNPADTQAPVNQDGSVIGDALGALGFQVLQQSEPQPAPVAPVETQPPAAPVDAGSRDIGPLERLDNAMSRSGSWSPNDGAYGR